jgi:hypothetical protein
MRGVASASDGARKAQKGWWCVSEIDVERSVECCGACRYFKELVCEIHTSDVLDGERVYKRVTTVCRRHPASVGKGSEDWCGEFARRGRDGVAELDAAPGAVPELDTAPAPAPAPAPVVRTVVLSEAMRRVFDAIKAVHNYWPGGGALWLGESNEKIKMEDVHAVALELEAAEAAGVDVGVVTGRGAAEIGGDANGGAA